MREILVVGTADTKGEELAFLAAAIRSAGAKPVIVDVGIRGPEVPVDVPAAQVADYHPDGADAVLLGDDRGTAVAGMAEAFSRFMQAKTDVAGIIGIGGGGGTSMIARGMQQLPLGVPKIIVSTLASGDVSGFVGVSDIIMVPSITDLAGLNRISRIVLHNAAEAIAAMVNRPAPKGEDKPSIGLTMFGVTTPCVTAIAQELSHEYDCLVFHATGTGGRTLEKLADSGMLTGLIDITTTEVCDMLFDGVLPANEDRFGAMARTRLPAIVSVGALDMVNFWAPETIPARFRDRKFYRHNPNVTLMRTTAEENRQMARWIGEKLNACGGPLTLLLPEKGISALDIEGGDFFDAEADQTLFETLEAVVTTNDNRHVVRLPYHINDPRFAEHAISLFRDMMH